MVRNPWSLLGRLTEWRDKYPGSQMQKPQDSPEKAKKEKEGGVTDGATSTGSKVLLIFKGQCLQGKRSFSALRGAEENMSEGKKGAGRR